MAGMTEQDMLEALKEHDTPSITNVVATYPQDPLCLGLYNPWLENWYTDQSIHCMYPELGPIVGYAVTCVYGLPDPNYARLSFMDVVDALDASQKPTVLVFQQKFPPELAIRLEHLIIGHQGSPAEGSPRPPMFPEVLLAHLIDRIDGRLDLMFREIDNDPGEDPFTDSRNLFRTALWKKYRR